MSEPTSPRASNLNRDSRSRMSARSSNRDRISYAVEDSPSPLASTQHTQSRTRSISRSRSGTHSQTESYDSQLRRSTVQSIALNRPSELGGELPFVEEPVAEQRVEPQFEATIPEGAPVIFDIGSGVSKVGFAGEDAPRKIFQSVCGRPRFGNRIALVGTTEESYVGDLAQHKRGILHTRYPSKHGIIRDWEGMEQLWQYAFDEALQVDSSNQAVLMSDPPLNPKKNRRTTTSIMFEKFDVPALFFEQAAVLSLYAAGRTTGMVCDLGQGLSHMVPVWEGWAMPYAVERLNIGGRDLTEYLMKLLMQDGVELVSTSNREIARDIKEKLCYCALDWETEFDKSMSEEESFESKFTLPDGQMVTVGSSKFRVCEPLFKPWQLGVESRGIHELIVKSMSKTDLDLHRGLMESIVVTGGSSLFEGLPTRLQKEMDEIATEWDMEPKIVTSAERQFSTFIGGSILASINTFQTMWISRDEFHEMGSSVVARKCF